MSFWSKGSLADISMGYLPSISCLYHILSISMPGSGGFQKYAEEFYFVKRNICDNRYDKRKRRRRFFGEQKTDV